MKPTRLYTCEEINSLHRVNYHEADPPLRNWRNWMLDIPELSFLVSSGLRLSSEIFASLGNSGTAVMRRWTAHTDTVSLGPHHLTRDLEAVQDMGRCVKLLETRHPDPRAAPNAGATVPALQVRGSWTRLQGKPGGVTEGREDFASFMLDSNRGAARIIAIFGRMAPAPRLSRPLPLIRRVSRLEHPRAQRHRAPLQRAPHRRCLRPQSRDLEPLRDNVHTDRRGSQGRSSRRVTVSRAELHGRGDADWENTLYVFGGSHSKTRLGRSTSPRVSADRVRIYLLFGNCDRDVAHMNNELHAAESAFAHTDFWSWSVKHGVWRQERMAGNPPFARTEMACAYMYVNHFSPSPHLPYSNPCPLQNEKLQQAVVFGGYHPGLPAYIVNDANGREEGFPYPFFADTFAYDMAAATQAKPVAFDAPKWRHMLSRSFGDLWELRVDVPGGHFGEVDIEEKARAARAGPWQRCFACGVVGLWKKCGGSQFSIDNSSSSGQLTPLNLGRVATGSDASAKSYRNSALSPRTLPAAVLLESTTLEQHWSEVGGVTGTVFGMAAARVYGNTHQYGASARQGRFTMSIEVTTTESLENMGCVRVRDELRGRASFYMLNVRCIPMLRAVMRVAIVQDGRCDEGKYGAVELLDVMQALISVARPLTCFCTWTPLVCAREAKRKRGDGICLRIPLPLRIRRRRRRRKQRRERAAAAAAKHSSQLSLRLVYFESLS
ncbi:hypothetical protein DFH09DRAFT_1507739 [Mycena vulgaris]|nr:hypothetical protein DFH09DRAFT_1507739 [Mycena vulgaris]